MRKRSKPTAAPTKRREGRRKKFPATIGGSAFNEDSGRSEPTKGRRYSDAGHFPPSSDHAFGQYEGLWHGTRRVLDPGNKRRKNKASWQREQHAARTHAVALKRAHALIAAELAK